MIFSEGGWWWWCVRHIDTFYLRRTGKNEHRVVSVHWVLRMFSLSKSYWGGWWLWGLFPAFWCHTLFLSLSFCQGTVCWHRGVSHLCSHACLFYAPALLLHECSEPVGSAGANEMYHWPHSPVALNTLLCVYTWLLTSNTQWTLYYLRPVCVQSVGSHSHYYVNQASSS